MNSVKDIRQGKRAREAKSRKTPSQDYVAMICHLYGDVYDDREEDSRIKGLDWEPGVKASHKSMAAFQKELEDEHGIHLSRTKLQKILITGHCWTTERSREIQWLYDEYTLPSEKGGKGTRGGQACRRRDGRSLRKLRKEDGHKIRALREVLSLSRIPGVQEHPSFL